MQKISLFPGIDKFSLSVCAGGKLRARQKNLNNLANFSSSLICNLRIHVHISFRPAEIISLPRLMIWHRLGRAKSPHFPPFFPYFPLKWGLDERTNYKIFFQSPFTY